MKANINENERKLFEKEGEIVERKNPDSLKLDKVLQDALKIAYQKINKDKFIEKYEVSYDGNPVSLELNLDYHFTKTTPPPYNKEKRTRNYLH